MQHFKFVNSRFCFLMSRTGYLLQYRLQRATLNKFLSQFPWVRIWRKTKFFIQILTQGNCAIIKETLLFTTFHLLKLFFCKGFFFQNKNSKGNWYNIRMVNFEHQCWRARRQRERKKLKTRNEISRNTGKKV